MKLRISKHPKSKGHSPEKLRLRIRGKTGKDVGAILRDDQTLGASVKRLSDNDKFAVQYLDTEEVVTSKDAIVSFILWRPIIHYIFHHHLLKLRFLKTFARKRSLLETNRMD